MKRTLLLPLILVAACYAQASRDHLVQRAAFDLNCDQSQLRYTSIDNQTIGVVGCNRRATYVETCDGSRTGMTTSCTWVLNGPQTDESPRAQAPGPATAASDDLAPPSPPR